MESRDIFRIIDIENGKEQGVYSRSYHDVYDFDSIDSARTSNCHDIYKEKAKYRIAKYKVTYELIDSDVDPPTKEEMSDYKNEQEIEKIADGMEFDNIFDRCMFIAIEVDRLKNKKLDKYYKIV